MFVQSDVNLVSVTTKRAPLIMDNITILTFHVRELRAEKLQTMLKSSQSVRGRAGIQTLPRSDPRAQALSVTQTTGGTWGWAGRGQGRWQRSTDRRGQRESLWQPRLFPALAITSPFYEHTVLS